MGIQYVLQAGLIAVDLQASSGRRTVYREGENIATGTSVQTIMMSANSYLIDAGLLPRHRTIPTTVYNKYCY